MSRKLKAEKYEGPSDKESANVVMKALNLMKTRKVARLNGKTCELLKVCQNDSVNKVCRGG